MWYVFDEHGNIASKDNSLYIKGSTYIFDGIEVYCLLGSADTDHPLFVDKNHDLSYYVNGSDWVDSDDTGYPPGTFGYEWEGLGTETGITATAVGSGLSNTNSLIAKNLQPDVDGWYVVWDKIKEFRQEHSDNWFLPSKDELNLIFEAINNPEAMNSLNNLSLYTNPYYWSSSEYSSDLAWRQDFSTSEQFYDLKLSFTSRSRLCYTI